MPSRAAYSVVRGRVLDGAGKPVVGASVRSSCDAFRNRVDGQVVGTRHASGVETTTDERGRFELSSVPKTLVYLRIDHPDTIPLEWGRDEQE